MLSPHEIATLMLVRSAPEQVEMTRVELGTLLESQFVALEKGAGGWRRLTLTNAGQQVLKAVARLGEKLSREAARLND